MITRNRSDATRRRSSPRPPVSRAQSAFSRQSLIGATHRYAGCRLAPQFDYCSSQLCTIDFFDVPNQCRPLIRVIIASVMCSARLRRRSFARFARPVSQSVPDRPLALLMIRPSSTTGRPTRAGPSRRSSAKTDTLFVQPTPAGGSGVGGGGGCGHSLRCLVDLIASFAADSCRFLQRPGR